ncbi:MAG: Gfo/Idh/MocA family protein [Synechococcales cyanobacterium]
MIGDRNYSSLQSPLRVGLIGTGYAAKARADAFRSDPRSQLVAITGHTPERTDEFAQIYQTESYDHWMDLFTQVELDLVVIANVNQLHGTIAKAALSAGKHVVVEYPLALNWSEARDIVALAHTNRLLLHVEHIELLGGLHQSLLQNLPSVGSVCYIRYATLTPQRPAPRKWNYNQELFGFPYIAALSRIHRLTHTFGEVAEVNCTSHFWSPMGQSLQDSYYGTCLCSLQLQFASGIKADVLYGKGECLWQGDRRMEIHGTEGALLLNGDEGLLLNHGGQQPLRIEGRRGIFAKDTAMVLDYLYDGTPLYVQPQSSLYALQVAEAAHQSALTGQRVRVESIANHSP